MFYDDSIRVILHHLFYEYHYSPHKLAFQNIMRAGDQKLVIDLEWPNTQQPYPKPKPLVICLVIALLVAGGWVSVIG